MVFMKGRVKWNLASRERLKILVGLMVRRKCRGTERLMGLVRWRKSRGGNETTVSKGV